MNFAATTNERRLRWALPALAIVHAAHVAAFWPFVVGATNTEWRREVFVIHAALLGLAAVALVWLLLRRRHTQRLLPLFVGEAFAGLYLFTGVALSLADQRIGPSTNALMTTAIGVAALVFIRPGMAVALYALAMGTFNALLATVQPDPNMLLSVRVNSLSAMVLAFVLAWLQWRNAQVTARQQQRIAEQQAELEDQNRKLQVLATTDALTGLVNRAEFDRLTASAVLMMEAGSDDDLPACLIMVDVDHFKDINDQFGHVTGDRVLTEVAALMRRMLRASDTIGRYGGEEFMIFLPGHTVEAGMRVAERLREAIRSHRLRVGEVEIVVTASFGVTDIAMSGPEMLARARTAADRALYEAKRAGRDCVRHVALEAITA